MFKTCHIFTLGMFLVGILNAATLRTADTSVQVEACDQGITVAALLGNANSADWIARNPAPYVIPFVSSATMDEKPLPLQWHLARETAQDTPVPSHGFVFTCDTPALELSSVWSAAAGPGPVEHQVSITNRGTKPVLLPLQTTLAFDLKASDSLEHWWVEKGANIPTKIGLHRLPIQAGFSQSLISGACMPNYAPREPIPWMTIHDSQNRRGIYVGVESSARVCLALARHEQATGPTLHLDAGLVPEAGYTTRLLPGETLHLPAVFVGCYEGTVDDGCNRLRRWVQHYIVPPPRDPRYPLLVNNSWGSGMSVDEALSRKMIEESAELGLEIFQIDAGWFRGVGDWRPDPKKFPNGLAPLADYSHSKGLKFGLWVAWTQGGNRPDGEGDGHSLSVFDKSMSNWFPENVAPDWKPQPFIGKPVCLGDPKAAAWCMTELRRIVKDYKLDLLEHDQFIVIEACSRPDHLHTRSGTDVSHHATDAYYRIYDTLLRENPDLLLEDCVNGGRIVDYGVLRRVHYLCITDTYTPIANRQAFYDASFALPPAVCECYVEDSHPKDLAGFVHMLRSGMMGWCTIMTNTAHWSPEEHHAAKRQFELYKTTLRPLILNADLYHISERPDGIRWDAIEYWNSETGKGAVFVFRGTTDEQTHSFVLQGLDPKAKYLISSEDGSVGNATVSGKELLEKGLAVHLQGTVSSDIIFLQRR